jgi:glycine cleavage system transcriptional repressor
MRTDLVFTLTGTDRVGLVEEVTGVLLGVGGNVETSRMARLGGEFAMLVLVSLPADKVAEAQGALAHLTEQGYRVSFAETNLAAASELAGWSPYRVSVHGADHEGIVHEVARGLSQLGISIESMETSVSAAPVTGLTLFDMTALVLVPPAVDDTDWAATLSDAARDANVDVEIAIA